ncbi:MAG: hypothetical protein ACI379_17285 [Nocardioides sp.]|uniref:hypothetical protein n=1 Tax=Nocardioides sp. TaxID=35761 RepID=UPI003F054D8A
MSRTIRTTTVAVIAATALTAGVLAGTPAYAGPDSRRTTPAREATAPISAFPGALEAGQRTHRPFHAGRRFITQHHTVTRPGPGLHLGASYRGHLLWETGRVVRVGPRGGVSTLVKGGANYYVLSTQGETLYEHRTRPDGRTVVVARSARTGRELARRAFSATTGILAGSEQDLLVTDIEDGPTRWWQWATDEVSTLSQHSAYKADLRSSRVALRVPGESGSGYCTEVIALKDPASAQWSSCTHEVHAFSPDGHRMLTAPGTGSDDEGPSVLTLRTDDKELARYRSGWFGRVLWEGGGRPVIQTSKGGRTTLARCTPDGCRRAAPVWKTLLFP